jgi:hypothetical protein
LKAAILSFPQAGVPAELEAQVRAMHAAEPTRREPVRPHDPALRPMTMLLVSSGCVISALDTLAKDISHAAKRFAARGLGRVVTRVDARRMGHGRRLVMAAREAMAASAADLGIFTAAAPLRPFYESCGWDVLAGCVLVGGTPQRPFPSDQFDKLTFGAFFTAHARRHAHAFSHARVALRSGEIDRLW